MLFLMNKENKSKQNQANKPNKERKIQGLPVADEKSVKV